MLDLSNILNTPQTTAGSNATSAGSSNSTEDTLQTNYDKAQQISSSAAANDTSKDFGIRLKGEMHYKVLQEGEVWDYNATSSAWTTNENGNIFSLNKKDQSFTMQNGAKTTTYASDLKTKLSMKLDNNSSEYNVAVIDDFDTPEVGGTDISHGEIVRALINSDNPGAAGLSNKLNFDAYDANEGGLSLTKVSQDLTTIDNEVKNGKDIDAINLSMGVSFVLSDVGLKSLNDLKTTAGRQQALSSLSANNPDLVTIINQISNMSDEGINFYISAGNDYGDASDDNPNETKGQLGVFNALSLATGTTAKSNVHTIGATATYVSGNGTLVNDTTGSGYAWYSDRGGDVETKVDGDVLLKNLGQTASGLYKYDINGDGKVDFYSQYDDTPSTTADEYQDPDTAMYEFDTDNDGNIDIYTTDINGSNQLIQGTSFAAPRAAKEKLA